MRRTQRQRTESSVVVAGATPRGTCGRRPGVASSRAPVPATWVSAAPVQGSEPGGIVVTGGKEPERSRRRQKRGQDSLIAPLVAGDAFWCVMLARSKVVVHDDVVQTAQKRGQDSLMTRLVAGDAFWCVLLARSNVVVHGDVDQPALGAATSCSRKTRAARTLLFTGTGGGGIGAGGSEVGRVDSSSRRSGRQIRPICPRPICPRAACRRGIHPRASSRRGIPRGR